LVGIVGEGTVIRTDVIAVNYFRAVAIDILIAFISCSITVHVALPWIRGLRAIIVLVNNAVGIGVRKKPNVNCLHVESLIIHLLQQDGTRASVYTDSRSQKPAPPVPRILGGINNPSFTSENRHTQCVTILTTRLQREPKLVCSGAGKVDIAQCHPTGVTKLDITRHISGRFKTQYLRAVHRLKLLPNYEVLLLVRGDQVIIESRVLCITDWQFRLRELRQIRYNVMQPSNAVMSQDPFDAKLVPRIH